jgi:hypothetical protein
MHVHSCVAAVASSRDTKPLIPGNQLGLETAQVSNDSNKPASKFDILKSKRQLIVWATT